MASGNRTKHRLFPVDRHRQRVRCSLSFFLLTAEISTGKKRPSNDPPSLYAALARNDTTSKREIRQFYKSSYYGPIPNRRTLVISPHRCGSVIVFPLRNIGKTDLWEKGGGGGGKEEGH